MPTRQFSPNLILLRLGMVTAIALFTAIDISLAVAVEGGLMVPVVRGADRLTLDQIAAQTAQLIDKARNQEREIRLGAEDYADEILKTLETNLDKFLAAVQRGRERLQAGQQGEGGHRQPQACVHLHCLIHRPTSK